MGDTMNSWTVEVIQHKQVLAKATVGSSLKIFLKVSHKI